MVVMQVVTGPPGTIAKNKIFAHPLPFNLIPHIDVFQENLYTKEEMKVCFRLADVCAYAYYACTCTCKCIAHADFLEEGSVGPGWMHAYMYVRKYASKAPACTLVVFMRVPSCTSSI
jgi:hypothetical protein